MVNEIPFRTFLFGGEPHYLLSVSCEILMTTLTTLLEAVSRLYRVPSQERAAQDVSETDHQLL
jgi:hypothetical protein